jgi:hypothetical protein
MVRRIILLIIVLGTAGILFFSGCKTADPASYTLTVTLGNGITGTPATGSYPYTENDMVNYSYSAQSGYGNLAVTMDGVPVANAGVVTMNASHVLAATAMIDIRGTWTGQMQNSMNPSIDFRFECTFSGGVLSGSVQAFIESEGNMNGDFTVDGNEMTITLNYSGKPVNFTGTFDGPNTVSGEWEFPYNSNAGTWQLER